LPLTETCEASTIRAALDALALKLDGRPTAATTLRRERSVFYNPCGRTEALEFNPIDKLRVRSWRKTIAV
jgi:hypothetical protein